MPVYNASIGQIDKTEVRRFAGLHNVRFDEARLEAICSEALLYIAPKGIWKIYDYDCQKQIIKAKNGFRIESKAAGAHLTGADKIICMAVTIGSQLENTVHMYFKKGAYVHGLLLDAAGAAAVQQAGYEMERMLTPKAGAQGYKLHWRYAPGYGDWPTEAQADLLHLCCGETIGITITNAKMLNPTKSVTAVIGLYPDGGKIPKDLRGCASCTKRDCLFRKRA